MNIIYETATHKVETSGTANNTSKKIRIITTGSLQRRFTVEEEVFITSDTTATVIKARLLNASYADLDFQDTIDGVNYICGVLEAGGIITDTTIRVAELLIDGSNEEKYRGV